MQRKQDHATHNQSAATEQEPTVIKISRQGHQSGYQNNIMCSKVKLRHR